MPKFLCSNFIFGTKLYDELYSSEILGSEKQCHRAQGGQGSVSFMPVLVTGNLLRKRMWFQHIPRPRGHPSPGLTSSSPHPLGRESSGAGASVALSSSLLSSITVHQANTCLRTRVFIFKGVGYSSIFLSSHLAFLAFRRKCSTQRS